MSDFKRGDFDSFCGIINDMLGLFDEIIDFENRKLDAIAANDVDLLDKFMKDEQAYVLRMKGLEQKREKFQALLGLQDLTFSEMTEMFESDEREKLRRLNEQLSAKALDLKEAITGAKRYIDLHLNSISALIDKLEGNAAMYGKNGEKEQQKPPPRFKPTQA